eukprot:scaffold25757_cov56-Attheya_sp.AAC.1
MPLCMNDPLVKWLSYALPIIMSTEHEFVDPHNEDTIDENGIRFQTIADVKKKSNGSNTLSCPTHSYKGIGASTDGTGSIFCDLVMKAFMRSKRDHIGNELEEDAVEYIADEISDDMYNNTFGDFLGEMMGLIKEQDRDTFNWD